MTLGIHVSGQAAEAVARAMPTLLSDLVATGITGQDAALWGPDAETDAANGLGWTEAVSVSRPLVAEVADLRDRLAGLGVEHIILCGMGGSSLAPEVIARTAGVPLTVLDSSAPGQVSSAVGERLASAAVVVSDTSGTTVETDSHLRTFAQAFRDAGVDPRERVVVVTDPGSPLEATAHDAGYRVFAADPRVPGPYSALTAFGLVPAGLAGADIEGLLDEAESVSLELAVDNAQNPGLVLGAAIAASSPLKDKLGIVTDGSHVEGFPDWAEQLVAESTGKHGGGILPVVLGPLSPELDSRPSDLQVLRLVDNAEAHHLFPADRHEGEILVSGSLGGLFLLWEYAVAVAARLLGVNPFDRPDVESAEEATRRMLDEPPAVTAPAFTEHGIDVRGSLGLLDGVDGIADAVRALLGRLTDDGYVAVQAFADRTDVPQLDGIRDMIAAICNRPVTFGWGPRFLHSTGRFHKGGPAVGVFLQIVATTEVDLEIPGRSFSYGRLIAAQAAGDAAVLEERGRPVLTLTLTDPSTSLVPLFGAVE